MTRYLNFFFVLLVVVGAAAVYDMKLAANKSASHVAELQKQIEDEREAIRLLKAEWSTLNQPDRLQHLVDRYKDYLQLEPLNVKQIVSPEDLPARPIGLEPVSGQEPMKGYAGNPVATVR